MFRHCITCGLLATAVVLASTGCQQSENRELPRLTEGGPACAPPTVEAESVDLIQGRVVVPNSQNQPSVTDASGAPTPNLPVFEYESGLRHANVKLRTREGANPIALTTTDVEGSWCVQKPSDIPFGGHLRISVEYDSHTLRAPVVRARGTRISVRSEALTRWIDQRDGSPLSRAALLNLEAIISTESDLLSPVEMTPSDSTDEIIERMLAEIRGSERIAKMVETIGKKETRGRDASRKNDSAGSE